MKTPSKLTIGHAWERFVTLCKTVPYRNSLTYLLTVKSTFTFLLFYFILLIIVLFYLLFYCCFIVLLFHILATCLCACGLG